LFLNVELCEFLVCCVLNTTRTHFHCSFFFLFHTQNMSERQVLFQTHIWVLNANNMLQIISNHQMHTIKSLKTSPFNCWLHAHCPVLHGAQSPNSMHAAGGASLWFLSKEREACSSSSSSSSGASRTRRRGGGGTGCRAGGRRR